MPIATVDGKKIRIGEKQDTLLRCHQSYHEAVFYRSLVGNLFRVSRNNSGEADQLIARQRLEAKGLLCQSKEDWQGWALTDLGRAWIKAEKIEDAKRCK